MKMKTILPGSCRRKNSLLFLMSLLALTMSLALTVPAGAQSLAKISTDTFTNSDSTHKTEVEPSTFAWGNTIVSAFHVARRPGTIGWGSADVGYATSTNSGVSWTYGSLPGLTVNYKSGTYGAAADPSVAYDAKHGQWLISTLPLVGLGPGARYIGDVAVSRSTDGLSWGSPINIDKTHLDDKNWTVCDNTTTSRLLRQLLYGMGSGVRNRRRSDERVERRGTDVERGPGFFRPRRRTWW